MKILYLKGSEWLLSQNERVRIEALGYRSYEALAKDIKPFFWKTTKWKDISALTITSFEWISNMVEECIRDVLHNKKKILFIVPVQSILFIPLNVKVAGFRIQALVIKSFHR